MEGVGLPARICKLTCELRHCNWSLQATAPCMHPAVAFNARLVCPLLGIFWGLEHTGTVATEVVRKENSRNGSYGLPLGYIPSSRCMC